MVATTTAIELPAGQLRSAFAPETVNATARTVELVWTTGARVQRFDFWTGEPWIEELAVTQEAVDLRRLRAGANLLESHRSWGLDGVLGVVEDAWIANGEGRARVRFSERPQAEAIFGDVKAGIIRNVSVAYQTHELEELPRTKGEPVIRRATRWEPLEVSFVAVPADAGAQVRNATDTARYPCVVRRSVMGKNDPQRRAQGDDDDDENGNGNGDEEEKTATAEPTKPADEAPKPDAEPESEKGAAARGATVERSRVREILRIVRRANLPETVSDHLVDTGATLDTARAHILDELAKRSAPIGGAISVGESGSERFRTALENVILHRLRPDKWPLTDEGRKLRGHKLYELARKALEIAGHRTGGLSQLELAGAALGITRPDRVRGDGFLSISDFPAAMLNIARATLTDGYTGAPRTFPQWTRRTTLPDFRPMNRIALGTGPRLLKVPEHAEFQHGKYDVHVEPAQLQTWGRIIALTRQAIINDDLSAFNRIPQQFGYSAAQMEGDLVYGILTGNPVMADGNALFSAAHKNLAPAAFINLQSMTVARQLMQVQTSTEGGFLSITPQYLICGPTLETEAYQFTNTTIVPNTPLGVIPQYFKSLIVVVDPRISDNSWFLAASPNQIDSIEYAYLEGAPDGGPTLETKEGWDIDGIEYKAREDFGATAVEWRGLVMTASQAGTPTMEATQTPEAEHPAAEQHNRRK